MLKNYQIVEHEGKFAVKNLLDNSILKSKESGNTISFPDSKRAENLRDYLDNQYNLIADASRFWFVKEQISGNKFIIRKIEI